MYVTTHNTGGAPMYETDILAKSQKQLRETWSLVCTSCAFVGVSEQLRASYTDVYHKTILMNNWDPGGWNDYLPILLYYQ
jgi:hypothetical protein